MEFKVALRGNRVRRVVLDRAQIRSLLVRRSETIGDLAARLGCRRESLSRLINGKRSMPTLRDKLAKELARMMSETGKA